MEPELRLQLQACKFLAPAPISKSFWIRIQKHLFQWKLKAIILFVRLHKRIWGVAKWYIWWIVGHVHKVLEALIYAPTRKITHTCGNPRSPRNNLIHLPHKLGLWNRKPNYGLRLSLHHLKVSGSLRLYSPKIAWTLAPHPWFKLSIAGNTSKPYIVGSHF